MGVDRRLEVLHGRVTLCRGTGHPDQGRLCVMSFAALLAGEPHSDIPARVSPLIRDYAVMLNDAMPLEELQRLKPFAPRILGTDDGRDSERVALLRSALELEILPRLRSDSEAASGDGPLKGWWRRLAWRRLERDAGRILALGTGLRARSVARVLAHAGWRAGSPDRAAPYWSTAVALLDRLCEVGHGSGAAGVAPAAPKRAEALLPVRGAPSPEAMAGAKLRELAWRWVAAAHA